MKTIWKFPLPIKDEVALKAPAGARWLSLQMQGDTACLWAVVNDTRPEVVYRFRIFGTGHPMPEDVGEYIGTVQLLGGSLVFHLFYVS